MPTDVYVTTMNSPASTIDSPIATAARVTNIDVDNSNEEYEQTFLGTRVAIKLGVLPFLAALS